MSKKFLLVDTLNLLYRAAHVTRPSTPIPERVGLSLHIMFSSLTLVQRKFGVDNVIFFFDGSSWRKKISSSYKMNRVVADSKKTVNERDFNTALIEMVQDLKIFLESKTNVAVLHDIELEADDLIAGWVQTHTNDEHVILSSDSDFQQLLSNNVSIFNGVDNKYTTLAGSYNEKGKFIEDSGPIDPAYFLFKKIIRGDTSDNIKPSYPGVREKSSKGKNAKIGILEAYADKENQGYPWNNFMQSVWTDENSNDILVKDAYTRNELLIDLTKQPEHIKEKMAVHIAKAYSEVKKVPMVGVNFLKFCGKYELERLAKDADSVARMIAKPLNNGE